MLMQPVWYLWISMSSKGDELHHQLHLVQTFSIRLCPGLICPCQRQHQGSFQEWLCGPCKEWVWVIFLSDDLTRIEGWSWQRTTRTMPMGCSKHGVQLSPGWLIALPSSMDKTSVDTAQTPRRSGDFREMSKQGSCVFPWGSGAAVVGDDQKCCQ